jgi:hypothetical protein
MKTTRTKIIDKAPTIVYICRYKTFDSAAWLTAYEGDEARAMAFYHQLFDDMLNGLNNLIGLQIVHRSSRTLEQTVFENTITYAAYRRSTGKEIPHEV